MGNLKTKSKTWNFFSLYYWLALVGISWEEGGNKKERVSSKKKKKIFFSQQDDYSLLKTTLVCIHVEFCSFASSKAITMG